MEAKITLKYLKKSKDKIRLFGKKFVENNKATLKIEIDGEKRELSEFYDNGEICNKIIDITLIGMEKVTNISHMFPGVHHYVIFRN